MKYNAEEALDTIPGELLATVELVNISYRCACDRVYYMSSLTTEKACPCGAKVELSRAWKLHYMKRDPAVRRQVRDILKKIQAT